MHSASHSASPYGEAADYEACLAWAARCACPSVLLAGLACRAAAAAAAAAAVIYTYTFVYMCLYLYENVYIHM